MINLLKIQVLICRVRWAIDQHFIIEKNRRIKDLPLPGFQTGRNPKLHIPNPNECGTPVLLIIQYQKNLHPIFIVHEIHEGCND